MDKITEMALEWHKDGISDKEVIENVTDTIMYDFIEQYDLELSDHDEAKLEMLVRSIVIDNINWDVIDEADAEARDYNDAKRSAIYR